MMLKQSFYHLIVIGLQVICYQSLTKKKNFFVEPYLPNYKIGIMHLAAGIWKDDNDMRVDKSIKIDIKTLENKTLLKSLRYSN